MKSNQLVAFIIFLTLSNSIIYSKSKSQTKHAITYAPHAGRIGDHICGYSKTKWLSYKYNIPLLFNPFVPNHRDAPDLFKQLSLFYIEAHADKTIIELIQKNNYSNIKKISPYHRVIKIKKESDLYNAIINENKIPTLFVCSFGTTLNLTFKEKFKNTHNKYLCDEDLQLYLLSTERKFASKLKKALTPVQPIKQNFPKGRISVAVHMRMGGGYDGGLKQSCKEYFNQSCKEYFNSNNYHIKYNIIKINNTSNKITPLNNQFTNVKSTEKQSLAKIRFLPKQYYVDQIIKLSKLLNNSPLFVYIFTDEKDPSALTTEIKNKVNLPNITWGCRIEENAHNLNIIEDFDAISQFDCLIRAHSNFSLGASLLGNHKIIIAPLSARSIGKSILLIDNVNIIIRDFDM